MFKIVVSEELENAFKKCGLNDLIIIKNKQKIINLKNLDIVINNLHKLMIITQNDVIYIFEYDSIDKDNCTTCQKIDTTIHKQPEK